MAIRGYVQRGNHFYPDTIAAGGGGGDQVVEIHGAIAEMTDTALAAKFPNGDEAQSGDLIEADGVLYRMNLGVSDPQLAANWGLANPPTITVDNTLPLDSASTNPVESQAIAQAFSSLIDGAPEDANTLKELNDKIDQPKSKNVPDFTTGNITLEYYAEGDSSVDGKYYPAIPPGAVITFPVMVSDRRILLATDWTARAAIDPPPTWVTDGTDVLDPADNTFPRNGTSFVWAIADTSTTPNRWLIRAAGTIESAEADANVGVDRFLDSGAISLAPIFRDDDTDTTGYIPYVFGEPLSEGDICFYEYHFESVTQDAGTGIAVLRDLIQHRFIPWDNSHRIKVIWDSRTPSSVWFAAAPGNVNLRITRVQVLRKAVLIGNQFITLTQVAYDALSQAQKDDDSKLYLIDG